MAKKEIIKQQLKARRKSRVRAKISGTAQRPRLSVFRSLKRINVQLIDDQAGKTLAAADDSEIKKSQAARSDIAFKVGELIAQRAGKLGIKTAVFDKSSYQYHGRVKAVAEGARQGGLKF